MIFSNKHFHLYQFNNSVWYNGYKRQLGLSNQHLGRNGRKKWISGVHKGDYIYMCLVNMKNGRELQTQRKENFACPNRNLIWPYILTALNLMSSCANAKWTPNLT